MENGYQTKPKGGLGSYLDHQAAKWSMKNLHKFFYAADLSWVNLLWTKFYANASVPNTTMKDSSWWKKYPLKSRKTKPQNQLEKTDHRLTKYCRWKLRRPNATWSEICPTQVLADPRFCELRTRAVQPTCLPKLQCSIIHQVEKTIAIAFMNLGFLAWRTKESV
jgi:hypothetical protein